MDGHIFELLVGWGLTVVIIVGAAIARDRALQKQITDGDAAIRDTALKEDAVLHERINRTRDEFVRRDDLDQHMKRIEGNLEKMYTEQRETNQRIDGFMAAMVGSNERPAKGR